MSPELKLLSVAVTVCTTMSLLIHVTVLLTPITTVMVTGEYPGRLGFEDVPFRIATRAPGGGV